MRPLVLKPWAWIEGREAKGRWTPLTNRQNARAKRNVVYAVGYVKMQESKFNQVAFLFDEMCVSNLLHEIFW